MIDISIIGAPQSWVIVAICIALYSWSRKRLSIEKSRPPFLNAAKEPQGTSAEDAYYDIEPLSELNLEKEEPTKIRPFKPKYHLTMAIENTALSDLIAMDKTYLSRIQLRRNLIKDHQPNVLAWNPAGEPAVLELYSWLLSTYLPRRFPTIYTPTSTGLLNRATNETLPSDPSSAPAALRLLGSHIDTDFLFLLPIPSPSADQGKYRLEAFITCFPSGFNTRRKLGLKLADIHGPVPGYAAKLEKSMDRFFASLPLGKIVKRHNWSVTTDTRLFAIEGNHLSEEEHRAGAGAVQHIDLRQTVLRCERQTLHRLPQSKALVFAFKTYQYPIQELRDEGSGEELAQAIDGLAEGSVPGMTVYKRQVVWGEKVKAFLRGEIGLDD